jgi:hypothetical protein
MRLAFAGDWHLHLGWAPRVVRAAGSAGAQVLIQLGDFGFWRSNHGVAYLAEVDRAARDAGLQVWVVPGNHEDYDLIEQLPADDAGRSVAARNVLVLPRGYRFTVDGVSFLAVGGAVSVDRASRVPGRSWWPQEAVTAAQEAQIVAEAAATHVLLCHDSPAGVPLPLPPPSPRAVALLGPVLSEAREHRGRIRRIADAIRPAWILHGHYHVGFRARLRGGTYTSDVVGLDQDGTTGNLALASTDRFRGLVDWTMPLEGG